MSGSEDTTTRCRKCGDDLYDIGWLFDPCPEDEDGEHQQ